MIYRNIPKKKCNGRSLCVFIQKNIPKTKCKHAYEGNLTLQSTLIIVQLNYKPTTTNEVHFFRCLWIHNQNLVIAILLLMRHPAGPWFNIKMTSYQYRKSHCGDKTILRPSYLHNGISYTGKMTSLYWIRAQVIDLNITMAQHCTQDDSSTLTPWLSLCQTYRWH